MALISPATSRRRSGKVVAGGYAFCACNGSASSHSAKPISLPDRGPYATPLFAFVPRNVMHMRLPPDSSTFPEVHSRERRLVDQRCATNDPLLSSIPKQHSPMPGINGMCLTVFGHHSDRRLVFMVRWSPRPMLALWASPATTAAAVALVALLQCAVPAPLADHAFPFPDSRLRFP